MTHPRTAAALGLRTVLVEKARAPGEKNVSGACLNTAALVDPDLRYLLDGPVEREIHSMRTYPVTRGRTTVIHEIPDRGILLLSIRRDRFDAWHTEQARKAGAEVRLGCSVVDIVEESDALRGVVTDSGERLAAKVVIDAGGVNSPVGRKAGLIGRRAGTHMILYVTAAIHLGQRRIDRRFGHEKAAGSFKGWSRIVRYVFPDIGLTATIAVTDGVPSEPAEGASDAAHISYEMSSDTFLAIARKERTGMQAYSRKLVKVKASMGDLLKLQKLDAV